MSDFNTILQRMLARVSAERDKRQGSIIYDTLAPVAAEIAGQNIENAIFADQANLSTAVSENLDNWAANFGIVRRPATFAVRIAEMVDTGGQPMALPVGSRVSTPNVDGGLNFTLIENLEVGRALLQCEVAGTVGNEYLGPLLPLFVINNLGAINMIGTYRPAENVETDTALRQRVIDRLNSKAYGGNVADYKAFTADIDGVGAVKVFPVWDGGGTVRLSIIDSELNPATPEFIALVQDEIDPIPSGGQGLGIAPIGHRVNVTTPEALAIDIAATVTPRTGYTVPQLRAAIEAAIEDYIASLRRDWAEAAQLYVFIARINAAIISVEGVDNVTAITINGSASDLQITQTAQAQKLPVLGSVVLTSA